MQLKIKNLSAVLNVFVTGNSSNSIYTFLSVIEVNACAYCQIATENDQMSIHVYLEYTSDGDYGR